MKATLPSNWEMVVGDSPHSPVHILILVCPLINIPSLILCGSQSYEAGMS